MGSGFKKENKEKMAIAKDKKQVILAIVVLIAFVCSLINMFVKINGNNVQTEDPTSIATNTTSDPAQMAPDQTSADGTQIDTTGQPTEQQEAMDAEDIYNQTMSMQQNSNLNSASTDIIIKQQKKHHGKMVVVPVNETDRSNPFLPTSNVLEAQKASDALPVPLMIPPENDAISEGAVEIMKTTISGILYDPYSPSAILNIKGSDYLVKQGDIINGYKILSITKTTVTVKFGNNIYKAGVGELLSKTDLDYRKNISNINRKFGGNSVTISVRKPKKN